MAKRKKGRARNTIINTAGKKSSALLDIIIPVYNRYDLLEKCLASIPDAAGDIPYNVVIVDNGSPEYTDEFYTRVQTPEITLVRLRQNIGFPAACNIGAARKISPLIFFLNSDVILDSGSIKRLVAEMDYPEVGVVGMKLVFPHDVAEYGLNASIRVPGKIQHIGISLSIHTKPIHHLMGWDENHPKVNAVKDVFAVTGAALMTRRLLWRRIGGFDEGYGMGTYEDVSYCVGVRDMRYNNDTTYKIRVVPEARGIHYTGATAEKYGIPYPLQINHLRFLDRHLQSLVWDEYKVW